MKKLFMYAVLMFGSLIGLTCEDKEQIVVQLPTNSRLLPVYLESFEDASSGFTVAYLRKLEAVLAFDFNHNGMTFIPKGKKGKLEGGNYAKLCKDLNVYYYIKVQVKDKKLAARMFSANNQMVKGVDNLPLSGDFAKDRCEMHQVADVIHKELFSKPGIASTHFLFTLKTKLPEKNEWKSDVFEADYDGGNLRQLTSGNGYCVTPAYIPPSKGCSSGSFFYVSYKAGQPKIYIASLRDSLMQRFCYLRGNQLMPAITSSRDQVAFISDVSGNPDLFIQSFHPDSGVLGKPRQIFASQFAAQGTPTFSPDGKKIAFVSNKDGAPRIYVASVPSGQSKNKNVKAELLTKYNAESTAPCWSPDGNKIAYCARTNGVRQIWIYDFLRGEERQITDGPGNKENPTWAPNSLHLIFNTTDPGVCELYLINLNQREAVKISCGEGEKRFPSWEPRV